MPPANVSGPINASAPTIARSHTNASGLTDNMGGHRRSSKHSSTDVFKTRGQPKFNKVTKKFDPRHGITNASGPTNTRGPTNAIVSKKVRTCNKSRSDYVANTSGRKNIACYVEYAFECCHMRNS